MTAPQAPYQEAEPTFDDLDPMERTIQSTIHEAKESIGADQPIEGRPRDASGKFVSVAEGQQTKPGEWVTLDDAPPATGEPAAPEIQVPEGHVVLPVLSPEKAQGFRVLDAEGEIVPPDLKFELNFRSPNGEITTREYDLPRLVNDARMGRYNHEREQQAIAVRNDNYQLTNRLQEQDTAIRQARQEREWLLTNPEYFIDQIKKYEEQNTPEARQAREREEIQTQRQQLEYQQAAHHNMNYLDTQIDPALNLITSTLSGVTKEELAGRLAMLIEPFKVRTQFGTILNPNTTQAIERLIKEELVPWAQQVHGDRTGYAKPVVAPPKAPPADTDLQARAAKAKRLAVSALRPVSGNAPQGAATSQKPPTSNRGLEDMIISRSVAGSRSG